MNPRINVAKLTNHFNNWKKCSEANNTHWIPKWEASIKEQLQPLPQGNGRSNHINFDWNKSSPDSLHFHLTHHQKDEYGRHLGYSCHTITIQTSIKGFNLTITGEADNNTQKRVYDLFHNTFYYQPDYHKNRKFTLRQLWERCKRLKNRIAQINLNTLLLKKQPAKS